MADVSSIDGYINPWRSSTNRSPSQDFADELAKEADMASSQARTQMKEGNSARPEAHAQAKGSLGEPADTGAQREGTPQQPSQAISQTAGGNLLHDGGPQLVNVAAFAMAKQQPSMVVQPVGVTEALLGSRVYGLHLLAGAYLSELALPEDATADTTLDAVETIQSSATSMEEQATSPDTLLARKTNSQEESTSVDAAVAQLVPVEGEETSNAVPENLSQAVAAAVSMTAPLTQWLERSLRITKQADGSTTAWLRDYRVDSHEAMSLRDSLLKEARAKGVVLGKIMLNGREVWTSRSDT